MQTSILIDLMETEEISHLYLRDSPLLFSNISKSLAKDLAALNHQNLLTLRYVTEGGAYETLLPKANREYAQALLAFTISKKREGAGIDSYLTPLITKVIEDEFIAFYSDEKRLKEVLDIVEKRLGAIREEYRMQSALYENLDMENIQEFQKRHLGAGKMTKFVLGKLSTETALEAFKRIAAILGKSSYKAVIVNMGKTILSSGIVAFIKPIVLGVLAKIGLAAIAKSAVAKALAVIIGIGSVTASIPAAYILLPVVLAFLSYEIYALPKKLAVKLPPEISRKLEVDFKRINERIVEEMVGGLLMELEEQLMRKGSSTIY